VGSFVPAFLQSAFSLKRFNANVWGQGSEDQTLTAKTLELDQFPSGQYVAKKTR